MGKDNKQRKAKTVITVKREGITLNILVNSGVNVTAPVFPFVRSFEDEAVAEIVRMHIAREIMNRMEEIRRVSYERGWNDAKKKRPKSGVFPTTTDVLKWEKGQ